MSAPRQVLRGATYLVTRRCHLRTLLLRPDPRVGEAVHFILARAAALFGVRVHACCVMSNHLHLVVTDPDARLPAFMQLLDNLTARALNFLRRRRDHVWESDTYSAVELGDADDVVDKVAYVLANPVAAGLVREGRQWPGLWTAPGTMGGPPAQVPKPRWFFKQKGGLPEVIPLALTVPPGFRSAADFRARVEAALSAREAAAQARRGPRGFLGARRVLETPWSSRPARQERLGTLNPRLAAGKRWLRDELIERLREFRAAYREKLARWRAGERGVRFPAGTYQLRVRHRAACAAAP